MNISASLVKELRERTDAPMMDCKKALIESNGDIEAAIESMRKKGSLKAEKKAGRVTAEGVIVIKISADGKTAVMVEINCETDFVARDESFKHFTEAAAATALSLQTQDVAALSAAALVSGEGSVEEARQALVAKIGENIQIRRIVLITGDSIGTYIHGGRIGVVIAVKGGNAELHKDLAMHIAATNPQVVAPADVPEELIAKEKEIFTAQALDSGKPVEIIEKMIGGRIKKYLDEVSLLGQSFVKDPEQTVGQLLQKAQAEVQTFARLAVGEGIEKKTENFAEEVMAQVRGS